MTIADFIPADQPEKLALIAQAAAVLNPVLRVPPRPAPTDADNVAALKRAVDGLTQAAADQATGRAPTLRCASPPP